MGQSLDSEQLGEQWVACASIYRVCKPRFCVLGFGWLSWGKLAKDLKGDSSTVTVCVLVSVDQTCHRVLRHWVVVAVKGSKLTEADE